MAMKYVIILCSLLFGIVQMQAVEILELRYDPIDQQRKRTVPIKVYLIKSDAAKPVILFSHGLGGSRENNPYLGRYWAEAGFVAVFMQHHGSDERVWKEAAAGQRFAKLKQAAGAQSFMDRCKDVPFVIDQLELWQKQEQHGLEGQMDLDHIGLSGHSFGAVTTISVSGVTYPMNIDLEEKRIDAFLAMSPQPGKTGNIKKKFASVAKPVLCMTGTKDGSPIEPSLKPSDRQKVYTALPAGDKYQLVLFEAEHHAFGDHESKNYGKRNETHHPAIQQISLKFWQAYLQDDEAAKQWLQSQKPIMETGLSDKDTWQSK